MVKKRDKNSQIQDKNKIEHKKNTLLKLCLTPLQRKGLHA